MSIIPEIIIQNILVNGIRDLRNNPWKVRQLFRHTPQNFNDQFSELLRDTPIDVTINYPREDSQFPCIAILLRAEEEAHTFIGDLLGAGFNEDDGLFGAADYSYSPNKSSAEDRLEPDGIIGEPSRLFDETTLQFKENRGSGFNSNYMLQIMTDDQDFTIFLYHAVRSIIVTSINKLSNNGLHNIRLSGTDFLPQASQQPNFIFMRGLSLSFTYFPSQFVILSDEEPVAKSFLLDINALSQSYMALAQQPVLESISVISGSVGDTITGITAKGYNWQQGFAISIFDPAITGSELDVDVTNLDFKNVSFEKKYVSGLSGQSNSTVSEYKAVPTETLPTGIKKEMILKVIGPTTHNALGEERRIQSVATGAGGSIKVHNDFSSSLAGAQVEVIKIGGEITFDIAISPTIATGYKDVKLTNPDLIFSTLENGFNVV